MTLHACFEGKTVVVVGGAEGIGRACALNFGRQKAKVIIADINEAKGNELFALLKQEKAWAKFVRIDATLPEEVKNLAGLIPQEGELAALINCVGGFFKHTPATEISSAEWDEMIRLNLYSHFYSCKELGKIMISQGKGSIVNVSSLSARLAVKNTPLYYSVAKAGVESLTRVLALEFGPYGIRVNAVAPGTTLSNRVKKVRGPEVLEAWGRQSARGKLATPEEIAAAVVFLASDEAVHVTGVSLEVSGGQFMV